MGRLFTTPGVKILRCLVKCGGTATLSRITRATNGKRTLIAAEKELEGLILVRKETPLRKKRRFPLVRVYLTARGWAAANALRRGWQPRRLATPVLKEWLAELVEERDAWALSLHEMDPRKFAKMEADAKELARLRSIKWIRPPLKQFGPKRGIQPAHGFQRRDGSSPAPGQPVPPRPADPRLNPARSWEGFVPEQPATAPPALRPQLSNGLSDFDAALRLQNLAIGSSRPPERFVANRPKQMSETDRAEETRILGRFNMDAYGGELLPGNKIRFNNRIYSLRDWERERFKAA